MKRIFFFVTLECHCSTPFPSCESPRAQRISSLAVLKSLLLSQRAAVSFFSSDCSYTHIEERGTPVVSLVFRCKQAHQITFFRWFQFPSARSARGVRLFSPAPRFCAALKFLLERGVGEKQTFAVF
ncbi:hypothetical protein TGDOM2_273075 [Toxoplasma gondii GAB2-2007-GAL-DOM2]|uniref:Uncharacterized protein n=5 Tax=Toxoplasma gondii TaxID=5811 RepID=S7V438_TOXGG|nr:hypothetical protein TGGT1_273075 [Toxoplasma gondii GT1]KAF4642072.1 hypothetical protein TGRH88_078850 [Toxoplasma gondii]KFG43070.1 hypothetical protein TGDOM2_273075 [Toxoplasma gondii GAB2-2007-GAL-DOM2]KFG50164.1 hypothetical protein TGFOU_273075 [Toxoplasma gondii FOU]PUA92354.1 hypothetical protein TGBR9_273075 [Toxoplasma gondii TgCATBr9]